MPDNERMPDGKPLPYIVRCRIPDGRQNEWAYETWDQADEQRRRVTEIFENAGEPVVITVLTPFNPLRYEVKGADQKPASMQTDHVDDEHLTGSGVSVPLCPKNGRHVLPASAHAMITDDEDDVTEALAAAYEGCEPCAADLERRVAGGNGSLVMLMTAVWLCSYAQIRASQGLPPARCADELFDPVFLKELDPRTRRMLRRLVLEPVEAPGGRAAAQPGTQELADLVINVAADEERIALWHDALDGAVGIVLMEAFRI